MVNWLQLSASSLWIRFAFPEDLLVILDKLLNREFGADTTIEALEDVIDSVFSVLGSSTSIPAISLALNERLAPLSEFCLLETGSSAAVRSVFAQLLKRSLPLGYDGYLTENGTPLSRVLAEAEDRWARRLKPLAPRVQTETFLSTNTWNITHVDIITPLFYHSRAVRTSFASWLEQGMTDGLGADLLVPLLYGFLDSSPSGYVIETRTWDGYFSQLLDLVWKQDASSPKAIGSAALVFEFSKDRPHFVSILNKRLAKSSAENVSHGILALASKLWSLDREDSEVYVGAVIDHAMQWVVRRLSDGSEVSETDTGLFRELGRLCDVRVFHQPTDDYSDHLIRQAKNVKVYLAEPVITSGVKYHMQIQEVISLCTTLVRHCSLKVWEGCIDCMESRAEFLISQHHRISTCNRSCNIPNSSLSVTHLLCPPRAMQSYGYSESCFTSIHRTLANRAISSPFVQYMAGRSRYQTEPSSAYFTSLKFTGSYRALLFYPPGQVREILGRMMHSALC